MPCSMTKNNVLRPRGQAYRRVLRGGSWNNNDNNCRLANRNRNEPNNRNNNYGFRAARDLRNLSCGESCAPQKSAVRVRRSSGRHIG